MKMICLFSFECKQKLPSIYLYATEAYIDGIFCLLVWLNTHITFPLVYLYITYT